MALVAKSSGNRQEVFQRPASCDLSISFMTIRSRSMFLVSGWAIAAVLPGGALPVDFPVGTALPVTAAVPAEEQVDQQIVALPISMTSVRFPVYTTDGSRILAAATSTDFPGPQLVSFTESGSAVQCLTCSGWNGPELLKPIPFRDGRRVLVRIGAQTSTSPADHGVVECTPSVLDCRSARVLPIVPPAGDDPNVVQDQREFRLAPDGIHVGLTQVRRTPTDGVTGVAIVGTLIRHGDVYQVDEARAVATGGELKGFTPDGQSITFARYFNAFEAGNPDDAVIDLHTGDERRLTTALDWDEDVDISAQRYRGHRWMVVGSARGTKLLETVSQIRRPTFIDEGMKALPFAVFVNRNPEIAEPWLTVEGESRGGIGQPLAPGAVARGWDSKPGFRWKPDATAVVFWQQRITDAQTRVVIAHLPERKPSKIAPARRTPTPRWAPPIDGYFPSDVSLPTSHSGRISGDLQIVQRPSPVPNFDFLLKITYRNYADETGYVINGVERSYYDKPTLY